MIVVARSVQLAGECERCGSTWQLRVVVGPKGTPLGWEDIGRQIAGTCPSCGGAVHSFVKQVAGRRVAVVADPPTEATEAAAEQPEAF